MFGGIFHCCFNVLFGLWAGNYSNPCFRHIFPTLLQYELWGRSFEITPVKLVIALLLITFSILEISPSFPKVQFGKENLTLLISATIAAIAGAYFGKRVLKKVTLRSIQLIVAVMLILISLALGFGVV